MSHIKSVTLLTATFVLLVYLLINNLIPIGVIANFIIIGVSLLKKFRFNLMGIFITSLALVDIVKLELLSFKSLSLTTTFNKFDIYIYAGNVSTTLSSWLMVIISLYQLYLQHHNFQKLPNKKLQMGVLGSVTVLSLLINLLEGIEKSQRLIGSNTSTTTLKITDKMSLIDNARILIANTIIKLFLSYLVPQLLIFILSVMIVVKLNSKLLIIKQSKYYSVILTTLALNVTYLLIQIPITICNVYFYVVSFKTQFIRNQTFDTNDITFIIYVNKVFEYLICVGSSINLIIFVVFNSIFRNELLSFV